MKMIALGVDAEALYTEPKLITGPAAEELIRGKGSTARKREMNATLLRKFPGSPKMVPDDDPREAISVDAASDFAADPWEDE